VSWDLHLLPIYGKNFLTVLTASVLGSDIFTDSVHIETNIFPTSHSISLKLLVLDHIWLTKI